MPIKLFMQSSFNCKKYDCENGDKRGHEVKSSKKLQKISLRHPNLKVQQGVVKTTQVYITGQKASDPITKSLGKYANTKIKEDKR